MASRITGIIVEIGSVLCTGKRQHNHQNNVPRGLFAAFRNYSEVKIGKGSTAGWGRLKSGAGWASLDYCTKV